LEQFYVIKVKGESVGTITEFRALIKYIWYMEGINQSWIIMMVVTLFKESL
jgi:hypothetical protein